MADRVSPARRAAFEILLRVETEGAFSTELLNSHRLIRNLAERDRGLTHEIVLGCLRWQGAIDALTEPVARRPIAEIDPEVRTALRMAGYQMRFLDRIPDRAAVSESVELIKSSRRQGAAGFVNAVLRRLPARNDRDQEMERSNPAWLVARWRTHFDEATVRRILKANQSSPATYLRLNQQYPRRGDSRVPPKRRRCHRTDRPPPSVSPRERQAGGDGMLARKPRPNSGPQLADDRPSPRSPSRPSLPGSLRGSGRQNLASRRNPWVRPALCRRRPSPSPPVDVTPLGDSARRYSRPRRHRASALPDEVRPHPR